MNDMCLMGSEVCIVLRCLRAGQELGNFLEKCSIFKGKKIFLRS